MQNGCFVLYREPAAIQAPVTANEAAQGQISARKCVNCGMGKEYKITEPELPILHDDGPDAPWPWEPQEVALLKEALQMSHAERFRLMTKLIRRGIMLKNAKITHKKI